MATIAYTLIIAHIATIFDTIDIELTSSSFLFMAPLCRRPSSKATLEEKKGLLKFLSQ